MSVETSEIIFFLNKFYTRHKNILVAYVKIYIREKNSVKNFRKRNYRKNHLFNICR